MKSNAKIKIYIVEDNFIYSYVLESMLKEHGMYSITAFTSGQECIEMLYNNPDVIILDYNLEKGMNGAEAFRIIHTLKPKIPVIVLSGQTDVQVAADLLKKGVFDYIEKNDTTKMLNKLKQVIVRALKKGKINDR